MCAFDFGVAKDAALPIVRGSHPNSSATLEHPAHVAGFASCRGMSSGKREAGGSCG